jgi:hypothetical protein
MSVKLTNSVSTPYILLARSFVVILGCLAVWWGTVGLYVFWQDSLPERIATHIISGDPFNVEILAKQLHIIDSIERSTYCRPALLRSAAIIQLRMVEGVVSAKDRELNDERLKSLDGAIRSSLSCAPGDPFLWLALYWVESTENNSMANSLKYLQMSYRLGPNEGWIALKRNHIAFAVFQQLPPDLADITINEFVGLLESKFYVQAAEIFIGPAWPERDLILPYLTRVAEKDRQLFANELYKRGYDVKVPGIGGRDARPWHEL